MKVTTRNIQDYLKEDRIRAIEFEVGRDCNLSCSYCPNNLLSRKGPKYLDKNLYRKILNELSEIDFIGRISFDFYNEPLLNKDLEEYVAIAKEKLPKTYIQIYTNGTMLSEKRLKSLIDARVNNITVTEHEGVNSSPLKSFDYRQYSEVLTVQAYTDITLFNRGGLLKNKINNTIKPFTPCYIPSFLATVTTSGNVLACYEDYNEQNIMGNCYDNTIDEIWNNKKFKGLRNDLRMGLRHKHLICKDCNRVNVMPGDNDK